MGDTIVDRGVNVGGPVTMTVGTGVPIGICGVNVGSACDTSRTGVSIDDGGGVNGDGGGVMGEIGDLVGSIGGGHAAKNRVVTMIAAINLSFIALSL